MENTYKVYDNENGLILRDYLKNILHISRRSIIKLKNTKGIKLNGNHANVNVRLCSGDILEIKMPDEISENILPESAEIDILYEDEYIIILNKASGIPVHPSKNHYMGTLANALVYYLMDKTSDTKVRPVNRIDKDTSGIVIFAKSSHVQHLFSMHDKKYFEKYYLAVVHGRLADKKGTIDAPIIREKEGEVKRAVREDGDQAITEYEVIQGFREASLIKLRLITGRTHQIRVHMSHIGNPLLGDKLYGGDNNLIKRQALHAYRTSFVHPVTNDKIDIISPLPGDMKSLLNELRDS